MIFISESIIDAIIDKYEVEQHYLTDFAVMISEKNDLSSFLDQENYELLSIL